MVILYPRPVRLLPREKILRPRPLNLIPRPIVMSPRPAVLFPRPPGLRARPPSYRTIVKRDMEVEDWQKWASTIPGFVDSFTSDMEGKESHLYDYQIEHLLNNSPFRHIDKSRQVGLSYGISAEALAKTYLKKLQTSIFISINQEEANEKIRYAESLNELIPSEFKMNMAVRNKQSLEFDYHGHRNRILSFAQRQPRGKGLNTDINLDEFAHMKDARTIYVASIPVITRGTGVLTLLSTPLGKGNKHYEIGNNRKDFPDFTRMRIYWWWCPDFLENPDDLEKARKFAPAMTTRERVNTFGNSKLRAIYNNTDELEFKQEYELYYIDSSISFMSLDLIMKCVFDDPDEDALEGNIDPDEVPRAYVPYKDSDGKLVVPDTIMNEYRGNKHADWKSWEGHISESEGEENGFSKIKDIIDEMYVALNPGSRNLLLGYDVGRVRDNAELSVVEQIEIDDYNLHIQRLILSLDNISFNMQENIIRYVLKVLGIERGKIDSTGLGAHLGENINNEFGGIEAIKFGSDNKGRMARRFKMRLEDRTIAIINQKSQIQQIHSIRRSVTGNASTKYDADHKNGHHGDKFWALALASFSGDFYNRLKLDNSSVIIAPEPKSNTNRGIMRSALEKQSVKFSAGNRTSGIFTVDNSFSNNLTDEFFDSKFYG